jgi:hypothetical protein
MMKTNKKAATGIKGGKRKKKAAKRTSPVGRTAKAKTAKAPYGKRKDGSPRQKPGRKTLGGVD